MPCHAESALTAVASWDYPEVLHFRRNPNSSPWYPLNSTPTSATFDGSSFLWVSSSSGYTTQGGQGGISLPNAVISVEFSVRGSGTIGPVIELGAYSPTLDAYEVCGGWSDSNMWSYAIYLNGIKVAEDEPFSSSFTRDDVVRIVFYNHLELDGWQDLHTVKGSGNKGYVKYSMPDMFVIDPSNPVTVISAQLDGIAQNIVTISNNVVDIDTHVTNIDTTLTEMHNELKDPTSPIWSAAGTVIGSTMEEELVPDETELSDVKDSFMTSIDDKLGGAKEAFDYDETAFSGIVDKIQNPSPMETIEFPGISVPATSNLEGFTILPPISISLADNGLLSVLRPILGTLVCIMSAWYLIGQMKTMIVAFLSGSSYFQFLMGLRASKDSSIGYIEGDETTLAHDLMSSLGDKF